MTQRRDLCLLVAALGGCAGGAKGGPEAAAGGPNAAPSAAQISITPWGPTTEDDLELRIVEPAVDPEGEAVGYLVFWFQDGVLRDDLTDLERVPARETARGERWEARVVANDGARDGAVAFASVEVQNSPPRLEGARITPDPAFAGSALQAEAIGALDPDGDTLRFDYAWFINGVEQPRAGTSALVGAPLVRGDLVEVDVTVRTDDGARSPDATATAALTVQSTPPTAPAVAIGPSAPVPGEALLCVVVEPATDRDGDPLRYHFSWTMNGLDYTALDETIHPGDTVPASALRAGQAWSCAVAADDGEVLGEAGSATVRVGEPATALLVAAGISFVQVPGGTLEVGCTAGQADCDADESPSRPTTLSRGTWMSRTELTVVQVAALLGEPAFDPTGCGLICPATDRSWHEAAAIANAASAAEGLPDCYRCRGEGAAVRCDAPADPYACAGFRLPTEAEWEAAARCGEDLRYAGDDTADAVAWTRDNSLLQTHPVGLLAPNACGLYDLSGNVWEWTHDRYDRLAYSAGPATDPSGPSTGDHRVCRGGAAVYDAVYARVSSRTTANPDARSAHTGLRLARTAP